MASWPPLSSSASAPFKRRRDTLDPSSGVEFSQGLQPTTLQSPSQLIPLGSQKAQPTAGLCNQQPRCGWDSGLRQLPLSSPSAYGLHFTLELYSSNIPVPIPDRPHPSHHPPLTVSENTQRLKITAPAQLYCVCCATSGEALPSLGLIRQVMKLELSVEFPPYY